MAASAPTSCSSASGGGSSGSGSPIVRALCSTAAAASSAEAVPFKLTLPTGAGPFGLNRIRDNYGARWKKRRVGRGVGSGRGRTATRGHKGMRARAGNHGLINKDGGATKLQKKIPKMGHWRPTLEYAYINLCSVEEAVKSGRLPVPDGRPIDVKDLYDARLVTLRGRHAGVKLLGRGADDLTTPLRLEVQLASQRAIEAVERAGGSLESVYYSRLTLRAKLKPHRFESAPVGHRHGNMLPRPALPPPKLMRDVYLTERHRGYLRDLQPGEVVRPQEHPAHVDLRATPRKPRYPGWAAADQQAMTLGQPYIKDDGTVTTAEEAAAAAEAPKTSRQLMMENPRRRRDREWSPPPPPPPQE